MDLRDVMVGVWFLLGSESIWAQEGSARNAEAGRSAAGVVQAVTAEPDFGDFTSMTLTQKAWEALGRSDYAAVEAYTSKCLALYEAKALEQSATLTDFASKEQAFDSWALNDVAAAYFIAGEALMAQRRYEEAKMKFERVVNDFPYAQAWDPKGWFWKVAVVSRGRLNQLLAEVSR